MPFHTDNSTGLHLPPVDLAAEQLVAVTFQNCCSREVWSVREHALEGRWAVRESGCGEVAVRNEVLGLILSLPSQTEVVDDGRALLSVRVVCMGKLPPGPRHTAGIVFQDTGTVTRSGMLLSPYPAYAVERNRRHQEIREVNVASFWRAYFGNPCDDGKREE